MSKEVEGSEYDLLIEVDFQKSKRFKKWLENSEIASGLDVNLNFKMTNVGDKKFPGGFFKEVSINYEAPVGGGLKTSNTLDTLIKPLSPGKKITIYKWETLFRQPGLAWIKCTIKPKNKKDTIKFYQQKDTPPLNEWLNVVVVIDRTKLEIIGKLEDIGGKLDKLVRKGN